MKHTHQAKEGKASRLHGDCICIRCASYAELLEACKLAIEKWSPVVPNDMRTRDIIKQAINKAERG